MLSVIKMVRYVPKGWVVGVVVWGMASGVFGSSGPSIKIDNVQMPDIEMNGDQLVTGKSYDVEVSYTITCDGCTGPGVKLTVSDRSLTDSEKKCSVVSFNHMIIPDPTELDKAFDSFYVDSPTNSVDMNARFRWSDFVSHHSIGHNTITLQDIQNVPKPFYVWVYYQDRLPNNRWIQCYTDNRVGITEESKDKARISGLENATLNDEGTYTLDNICIYSTTGEVSLYFNGGDVANQNEAFELRNSNDARIPYTIRVASKQNQKTPNTYEKDGRAGGHWPANDMAEDCNNIPNMAFTIQADKQDINAASTGVYSDTMTVTVEPK